MARADVTDMVKGMRMENVTIMVKSVARKTAIMARVTDRCMDMDLVTAENTTEALAEKLGQLEALVIPMKVSQTGTIYGSVTNVQIAEKLTEKGFDIERKTIVVPAVKEVGEYTATVNLHKEVSVEIPFQVIAEA